jgi:hypothetical protein
LDEASIQALTGSPTLAHAPDKLLEMAQALHAHYLKDNPGKLPSNMRPWERLGPTFQKANLEQARYVVQILRAAGFEVRSATGGADAIKNFAGQEFKDDVEHMAELEHGRWNVERLRDGWRYGAPRDDAKKLHNCLVAWKDLPDDIRQYDRNGVRAFPEILAGAGFEIFRM